MFCEMCIHLVFKQMYVIFIIYGSGSSISRKFWIQIWLLNLTKWQHCKKLSFCTFFNCFNCKQIIALILRKKSKTVKKNFFGDVFIDFFKITILTPRSFHPDPYSIYGSWSSHSNEHGSLRIQIPTLIIFTKFLDFFGLNAWYRWYCNNI